MLWHPAWWTKHLPGSQPFHMQADTVGRSRMQRDALPITLYVFCSPGEPNTCWSPERWSLVGAHKGVPMKGIEGPCAFLSLYFPSWVMEVAGLAPACRPTMTCLLHFQSNVPANHELPPPTSCEPKHTLPELISLNILME